MWTRGREAPAWGGRHGVGVWAGGGRMGDRGTVVTLGDKVVADTQAAGEEQLGGRECAAGAGRGFPYADGTGLELRDEAGTKEGLGRPIRYAVRDADCEMIAVVEVGCL